MIFRIDGEAGELLALEPILREWKKWNGDQVYVETSHPEIFALNPVVDKAAFNIPETGPYYDMNMVQWRGKLFPVEDLYADLILGNQELSDKKPRMYPSDIDKLHAESAKVLFAEKPLASIAFDPKMFDATVIEGVEAALREHGYDLVYVNYLPWNKMNWTIGLTDLFVGSDGDAAAIALTTDAPAIVCYSYRSPVYFPPFRGDVPFIGLTAQSVCPHSYVCHQKSLRYEFAKGYVTKCDKKMDFLCKKRVLKDDVSNAIKTIMEKRCQPFP